MIDREKVIKALDLCSNALYCADQSSRCDQCPYRTKDMTGTDEMNCSDVLMADALALLKEQEAKIKQLNRFINGFSRDAIPVVRCKDCKHGQLINGEIWCFAYVPNTLASPDWFCADGVKKDE